MGLSIAGSSGGGNQTCFSTLVLFSMYTLEIQGRGNQPQGWEILCSPPSTWIPGRICGQSLTHDALPLCTIIEWEGGSFILNLHSFRRCISCYQAAIWYVLRHGWLLLSNFSNVGLIFLEGSCFTLYSRGLFFAWKIAGNLFWRIVSRIQSSVWNNIIMTLVCVKGI